MKFTKMQGIGNDYVYVNCLQETIENPSELAKKISDRHYGVGSDGLIMINPSDKADFEMEMYNADGSQGIMCGNDDIASQVIQILAENQLAGQVIVVGQDGDLAACQRIVEGTQYMTAFKSIEDLARQAAEYAVKMAEEGKISSDVTDTMNDGSYDIPAKVLEPVAVTRDNIDEVIIDGGFHRRDEVYLNIDYDTE